MSQSCRTWEPLSPACKWVGYRPVNPIMGLGAGAEGRLLEPEVLGDDGCWACSVQLRSEEGVPRLCSALWASPCNSPLCWLGVGPLAPNTSVAGEAGHCDKGAALWCHPSCRAVSLLSHFCKTVPCISRSFGNAGAKKVG